MWLTAGGGPSPLLTRTGQSEDNRAQPVTPPATAPQASPERRRETTGPLGSGWDVCHILQRPNAPYERTKREWACSMR